jgi:uncharacterized repeat protein (TIGR01451 family)
MTIGAGWKASTGRDSGRLARTRPGAIGAVVLGTALAVGMFASPVGALPGSPGVPQAPASLVYHEDFENQRATNGVRIGQYTGGAAASTETYVTSPKWAPAGDQCNGWILNSGTPLNGTVTGPDSGCDSIAWPFLQSMATAIGLYKGQALAAAKTNQILSEYTNGGSAPGPGVEFQTAKPITTGITPGHFYLISAIYGAANCASEKPGIGRSDPNLTFNLIQNQTGTGPAPGTGGGTVTTLASGLNPCTDAAAQVITTGGKPYHVAELKSAGFRMPPGVTSLGIQLANAAGGFLGNDSGFDDPSIVDATPQLDKAFSPTTVKVGQTSTLTFTITNTDDLQAKNGWSFSDTLPAGLVFAGPAATNCPAGVAGTTGTVLSGSGNLDAGLVSCTFTVPITSATEGSFTNGPSNIGPIDGLLVPGTSTVIFTQPDAPAIKLVKLANLTSPTNYTLGRVVTYSYTVTNTGNVPLTAVTVTENSFTGSGPAPTPNCPATTLAVNATMTCTATYTLTQPDINAGSVANAATAAGTPPTGPDVNSSSDALISGSEQPSLDLTKIADASAVHSPAQVGEPIGYTITARNTGNVSLQSVTITDTLLGPTLSYTWPGTPGTLEPGQSVVATASHSVTQADIDTGIVLNTATADGKTAGGTDVPTIPASTQTPLDIAPHLALTKSAAPAFSTPAIPGDPITYTFTITNDGNVTLHSVALTDTLAGLTLPNYQWPGPPGILAPTQTATATATYPITRNDIDAGVVANTAIANGTTPAGGTTPSDEKSTTTPIPQAPALHLTKTADASALHNPSQVGDPITYHFAVTNTGNVTLTATAITDTLTGLSPLTYVWPGADGELAPGQGATATATYGITQDDINAGTIVNNALATSADPGGIDVPSNPATTTTPTTAAPGLSLVKSATPNDAAHYTVGQQIIYTFLVTNTGNVGLTNLSIAETTFSGTGSLTATCPANPQSLAPTEQVACTATYTLTATDITAGQLTNTATAGGTDPGGDPVTSNPFSVLIPAAATPAATILKTADVSRVTGSGQIINYSYAITNTGNVTLTNETVNETIFTGAGSAPTPTCPLSAATLLPGATVTCTATYITTDDDMLTGTITNTAIATGTPATGGDPVSTDPSTALVDAITPAPPAPPEPPIEPLAFTGGPVSTSLFVLALGLVGGGLILQRRWRRRHDG